MGNSTGILPPQELSDFRNLETNTTEPLDIPERPENRSCTDKKFLVVFIITIILLFPFLIYTLVYSDIDRLTFNSDSCGYLCGVDNTAVKGIDCSGGNFANKTFVQYNVSLKWIPKDDWTFHQRNCVDKCPENYNLLQGSICYPSSPNETKITEKELEGFVNWNKVSACLRESWWKFIVGIFVTIVLCIGVMLLLRYIPAIVVWGVLCIMLCYLLVIAVVSWNSYFATEKERDKTPNLSAPIVHTVVFLIVLALTVFFFRRIKLIVLLYKEATKAIFSMPLIILVPVVIILVQLIVFLLFATTTTYMYSAGKLSKDNNSTIYSYESDAVMKFTLWFNFVVFFWVTLFFSGCQYIVIAGIISSWYFSKNKHKLGTPIWTSISNLFRFHLGSVAFGALIINSITLIRALIKNFLTKGMRRKEAIGWWMGLFDGILRFMTNNAYIVTAIHGQSIYKSGKRALKLLVNNAVNLIAINSAGSFVLRVIQVLLIIIINKISEALFMSYDSNDVFIICFFINVGILITMFSLFTCTIDTLFICCCEDSAINDGISRPYFMNKGLMEFFETSKAVLLEKTTN